MSAPTMPAPPDLPVEETEQRDVLQALDMIHDAMPDNPVTQFWLRAAAHHVRQDHVQLVDSGPTAQEAPRG